MAKISVEILNRLHPEIQAVQKIWGIVSVFMNEDREKYADGEFYIPLPNEDAKNKNTRMSYQKSGFVNPSSKMVNEKIGFIEKEGVSRSLNDDDVLSSFVEKADLSGQSLAQIIKNQISPTMESYGTVFIVVDKPKYSPQNREEELKTGLPYICVLDSSQVVSFGIDEDGELSFFRYKIKEAKNSSDAFAKDVEPKDYYVTWTKTEYFKHDEKGEQIEDFTHNWGVVPVAIQTAFKPKHKTTVGRCNFFKAAYYLIMANFHLTNSNHELGKFATAVLVSTENDFGDMRNRKEVNPDSNRREVTQKSHEFTNVFLVEDMAQKPEYLTKDLEAQAAFVESAKDYFDLAERQMNVVLNDTKEAQAPESGVAKAYDFQDINAATANHAADLEELEIRLLEIVNKTMNQEAEFSINYPRDFNIKTQSAKITAIKGLLGIRYPSETGMQEAYQGLTKDLTKDPSVQEKINKEIEEAELTSTNEGMNDGGNNQGSNNGANQRQTGTGNGTKQSGGAGGQFGENQGGK